MPIYEFECPQCGEEEERILAFNFLNPNCKKCGEDMRKLISPLADFKGGGRSARRRWCEKWTPDTKEMKKGRQI